MLIFFRLLFIILFPNRISYLFKKPIVMILVDIVSYFSADYLLQNPYFQY